MGTSVNAQLNSDSEYVQSVKNMLDIVIARVFSPIKMTDWTYFFTEDYRKEKKALKVIHSYTWNVIKRRQEFLKSEKNENHAGYQKRKAFLDLLLEANSNGEQLTLEEIREEVDTFMFAVTLNNCQLNIAKNEFLGSRHDGYWNSFYFVLSSK